MVFRKKKGKGHHQKFCPRCGHEAHKKDTYCTNCGYSFEERRNKQKEGVKWKRLIILAAIILIIYFAFRFLNNLSLLPSSLEDIFNFTSINKTG